MKTALILVEGATDKEFLDAYIWALGYPASAVDVVVVGGAGKLRSTAISLIPGAMQQGRKIMVAFDANSDAAKTRARIADELAAVTAGDADIPLFLFPDNRGGGDLEDLLLQLTVAQHAGILQCVDEYNACLRGAGDEYYTLDKKSRVHAYKLALGIADDAFAGDNHVHWDLAHPALTPLQQFLHTHLPQ